MRHADETLRVYATADASLTVTLPLPGEELLAFTPDNDALVTITATNEIRFHAWRKKQLLRRLPLAAAAEPVKILELSPDARWLAGGGAEQGLWRWDTENGRRGEMAAAHVGHVSALHFSPDSRRLATGGADGQVCVWDVATGRLLWRTNASPRLLWCVRFSPDGRRVAAAGRAGEVTLWHVDNGQPLVRLADKRTGLEWLDWTPDGQRVVTSGAHFLRVWHLPTRRELLHLPSPAAYLQAVVSPDGGTLAVVEDAQVRVWCVGTR